MAEAARWTGITVADLDTSPARFPLAFIAGMAGRSARSSLRTRTL
jgi:hypothetical protein